KPGTRRRSTSMLGAASRKFRIGMKLWPPAIAFASGSAANKPTASSSVAGARYSKGGGFILCHPAGCNPAIRANSLARRNRGTLIQRAGGTRRLAQEGFDEDRVRAPDPTPGRTRHIRVPAPNPPPPQDPERLRGIDRGFVGRLRAVLHADRCADLSLDHRHQP